MRRARLIRRQKERATRRRLWEKNLQAIKDEMARGSILRHERENQFIYVEVG